MSSEVAERPAESWYERYVSCPRSPWVTVGIGLLLVLAPVGAAYLDGVLDLFFYEKLWHLALLPSAVIIYILIVASIMERMEANVVDAFRPVVQIDDEEYERLVIKASHINPVGEGLAMGLGAIFGLWVGQQWLADTDLFWLRLCLALLGTLMFGLLGWTIYALLAATRLMAELHRQPLCVDLFDQKPFEPIGRQSLIGALVFVGGNVLGMLFALGGGGLFDWQNWVITFVLMLVPVLLFFLNMRHTHRVLAAEKERELEAVETMIPRACRTLMERLDAGESAGSLADEINVLVAYEERVKAARTWPYDTAMLRTLFFSVVIPAATALAQNFFTLLDSIRGALGQ